MNKKLKDLEKVEKREKTFSTLAKEEGKGARKRQKSESKKGLKISAKDSQWETKVDEQFAKIRAKKADEAKKKLQRIK